MKLIQIFAIITLTAAFASAQSGSATPKPGGQPPAGTAAPTPAKGPVVTVTPAPAAKSAHTTSKKPAAKKAVKKATGPSAVPAKPAASAGPKSTRAASTAQSAPAAAKNKPVVATGSLPEKHKSAEKQPSPTKAKAVVANSAAASSAKPGVTGRKNMTGRKQKAPAKTTAKSPVIKPTVAHVEPPPKIERKATPARLLGAAGRRDPFVSPIRNASAVSPTASCTSGKRCLSIPELVLQGTVRDITGKMLAVVSTSNRRTYTLRENDQVFNGSVEKITTDSIIFREFVKDPLGRESAREVVKKLGPTS